jgi:N-formylglutamate amidohydrolase
MEADGDGSGSNESLHVDHALATTMSKDYFRVERPDEQTLPVVVDVPHAGEWIPDEVKREMVVGDQVFRRDLDLYVDRLWAEAPDQGATLVASNVSRYVVDLNRAPDDVTPRIVEGGETKDEPGYYQDRGVVWRNTTGGTPVMDEPLDRDTFEKRLDSFYFPYHRTLEEEIARVRDRFGVCILLDGHSMPSTGRQGHSDPGRRRADVVPGDVEGTSCAKRLRWTVEEHYRDRGYSVKSNDPYQGGWITRHYGRPGEDVHAIQIEVNRDLYMDEETFEPNPDGMKQLRDVCTGVLEELDKLSL